MKYIFLIVISLSTLTVCSCNQSVSKESNAEKVILDSVEDAMT